MEDMGAADKEVHRERVLSSKSGREVPRQRAFLSYGLLTRDWGTYLYGRFIIVFEASSLPLADEAHCQCQHCLLGFCLGGSSAQGISLEADFEGNYSFMYAANS
eukprot:1149865-Pelagomonas_calceolata.AAC.10